MQKTYPVPILFRAPKELAEQLAAVARQDQETKSNYLRRLIRADIARRQSGPSRAASGFVMHDGPHGLAVV